MNERLLDASSKEHPYFFISKISSHKAFLVPRNKISRLLPQTSPTLLGAKHCLMKKKVLANLEAATRGVL